MVSPITSPGDADDAIASDHDAPVDDGWDVTRELGEEPVAAAVPVPEGGPTTGFALTTTDRMARLRSLVRVQGLTIDEAAREIGVDPIVANLWLRLPETFWSTGGAPITTPAIPTPLTAAPIGGVRRVLSCRVPAPAFERLRVGDGTVIDRALAALEAGLQQLDGGMALPVAGSGWRGFTRSVALTVEGDAYVRLRAIAENSFNDDLRDAAGWLIARGVGVAMTNPVPVRPVAAAPAPASLGTGSAGEPAPRPIRPPDAPATSTPKVVAKVVAKVATETVNAESQTEEAAPAVEAPAARLIAAVRRRSEPRVPLPPDDSAPDGDELRRRREIVAVSQRDLAAASGLSRGLVAEVERGRRRHVLTRARIAETLDSLAAKKGVSLAIEAPAVAV